MPQRHIEQCPCSALCFHIVLFQEFESRVVLSNFSQVLRCLLLRPQTAPGQWLRNETLGDISLSQLPHQIKTANQSASTRSTRKFCSTAQSFKSFSQCLLYIIKFSAVQRFFGKSWLVIACLSYVLLGSFPSSWESFVWADLGRSAGFPRSKMHGIRSRHSSIIASTIAEPPEARIMKSHVMNKWQTEIEAKKRKNKQLQISRSWTPTTFLNSNHSKQQQRLTAPFFPKQFCTSSPSRDLVKPLVL